MTHIVNLMGELKGSYPTQVEAAAVVGAKIQEKVKLLTDEEWAKVKYDMQGRKEALVAVLGISVN